MYIEKLHSPKWWEEKIKQGLKSNGQKGLFRKNHEWIGISYNHSESNDVKLKKYKTEWNRLSKNAKVKIKAKLLKIEANDKTELDVAKVESHPAFRQFNSVMDKHGISVEELQRFLTLRRKIENGRKLK
jgi:hypothetical protein